MSVPVKVLLSALVVMAVAVFAAHPALHVGETVLAFTPERGVTAGDAIMSLVGLAAIVAIWRR